jgi:hypothetical protein
MYMQTTRSYIIWCDIYNTSILCNSLWDLIQPSPNTTIFMAAFGVAAISSILLGISISQRSKITLFNKGRTKRRETALGFYESVTFRKIVEILFTSYYCRISMINLLEVCLSK